jgi:FtsH-binding integral membrane protein
MAQTYTGGDTLRIPGLDVNVRAAFITRTYNHLLGAVLLFTALEILYFQMGWAAPMARAMLGVNWLLVLGAFVIVSWFASRVAHTSESKETQYLALGGFVLAESIIFVPMLYIANAAAPGAIQSAATMTVVGFLGLTVVAFTTRKDFSFLGALLRWSFVLAILAIVGAVLFGFALGTWFSVAMVGLAGGAILYDTSNVIHHFPEDRYVGAALQLFASVALMFWYMLRLFMNRD